MAEKKEAAPEKDAATLEAEAAAVGMTTGDALGLDETKPGGVYIVDGKKVDANGDPIGKKKDEAEE